MRSRINRMHSKMEEFDFIFSFMLGTNIMTQTDNLSRTLQQPALSAAEGQQLAKVTLKVLQSQRSDDVFNTFWEQVLKKADEYNVGEPTLPRKQKNAKALQRRKSCSRVPSD